MGRAPRGASRSHAPWVGLLVAVLAVASDQVTKWWALGHLTLGEPVPLIGRVFSLQLVWNSGAAFSLGTGATWVFTLIAAAIVVAIGVALPRVRSVSTAVALGLLAGGALGNLLDRITQPPSIGSGHVVDFLNYNGWFVGNVADIWIVVAAVWLALSQARVARTEGRDRAGETPPGSDRA